MSEGMERPEHEWEAGWEGHERAQRVRLARLPFSQKLRWIEEASRMVRHLREDSGRTR